MNLISPEEFKKNRKVRIEPPATQTGGLNLISPNEFKAEQERKKVEKLQSMGEEFKQIGKTIASPFTGLIQALKTDKQRPVQMVQPPTVPSIRSQINAAHVNSLENFKQAWPTQSDGLVDRPPYLERVKQKASEWPELLKPVGLAVEGLAQAPFMLATREALGTTRSEEEGFKPVTGAGRVVGDILAPVGTALTMPGAGLPGTGLAGGAMYNQAGHIITRAAPRLGTTAGGRTAETAIKSAAEGVPLNVATELALNPESSRRELALAAGIGGVGGAALGGIGRGIGEAIKASTQSLQKRLGSTLGSIDAAMKKEFPARLSEAARPDMEPLGISAFAKQEDYGIKNPKDTRSHIVTKTGGEKLGFVERVKRFYEKSVNNVERLNAFDKYVEEVTGKKLSPQDRAHVLALNQRGADMIANVNLTEALVDAQGNVIGKSLKDITKNIPRRRMVDFEDYIIAKHAQTRMARGERVYAEAAEVTPEKLADKIKYYERQYPEFARIADELYDYSNKLGEAWLVDTGIISRETWNQWRQENPFWIPMKREFKDIEYRSTGKAKRSFFNQNSPIKAYSATGSERKIISPIESMIEYVDSFVKTAKRNEVMQSVVRSLKRDPEAFKDFAEVIPAQAEDMGALLRGEDGMEQILNSINEGFEKALQKPDLTKGNVVSVLNNGKREYVKVNDPAFLEALTNLSPQTQSAIINATGKVTNVMKVLTTGINPVFSLTRNIFYDIPQAFAFSKTTNNPIRFAWDLLDGVISTFGNRELYRSYKAMGGGHSSSVAADRNLLAQSKRAIMPQRQKMNLIRKAYAGLENLANVIESAPRLGEFKRITKAGGNTYDSRVKGLFEAQDVTTNFKRYGNVTKQADAIFPYLNAAIQGLDKFVRAFKDNPVQVGLKAFSAVTIPTVALYALNYDNPKYKKLSNYTKDRFFLIPTTDEKNPFIKIPKPRELGIPFGALVERSLRLLAESDPEAFKGFADQVRIAFAPPGISAGVEDLQRGQIPNPFKDTIMGPLMELESNRNFAGSPIVPGYLEGVSPRYQYDANTSELSKKIGDVLNVSPKQIDHLIRSYGGVIGQVGIPATSQGSTLEDTLKKQVTADPVFSTDATRYFYELKDRLDRQYKDIGVTGEIPKGYNDGARKYLGRVASTMGDITKQIREVDKSNLSREQKLNRKRELTEMRNELAREAYQRVIEALQ